MPHYHARKNYTRHPLRNTERKRVKRRAPVRGAKPRGHKKFFSLKGTLYIVAGFVVAAGIAYGVFLTPILAVSNVEVRGTENPDVYLMVNQWLQQQESQLHVGIRGDHMFTVPVGDLADVLELDKRIDTVTVTKKFPRTLVVDITTRNPQVVYMRDGRFYILNEEGRVVDVASENVRPDLPLVLGTSTDEALLPTTEDDEQDRIISESATKFMSALSKEFPRYFPQITIVEYTFVPESIELHAHTSAGWYILFDPTVDVTVQLSNLSRVYNEKISKEEKGRLEYIDVRLENYVYYK